MYSVIMPAYNAEKTINKSIESVLNQTFTEWELIIVDDGSTDSTRNIVNDYVKRDARITMITQNNSGPGIARNNGIKKASGDYIAFLDSDDYWDKNYLYYVNTEADNHGSDLIFIESVIERENGTPIEHKLFYKYKNESKERMIRHTIVGNLPWGMGKVVKKELMDQVGQGFLDLNVGEELLLGIELISMAKRVSFSPLSIYHYVQRDDGQHKKGGLDPWCPVVKCIYKYFLMKGELDIYIDTINSLAIKAMSIMIYRCSCTYSMNRSVKLIRKRIMDYRRRFSLSNYDKKSLDRKNRLVVLLIKFKMYRILYFASKFREFKRSH